MKIHINQVVTEDYVHRTQQLLRTLRFNFGPRVALLVKKILLISLYVEYHQGIASTNHWVNYEHILERNERLVKQLTFPHKMLFLNFKENEERNVRFILDNNLFTSPHFMDIPKDIIINESIKLKDFETKVNKICKQNLYDEPF